MFLADWRSWKIEANLRSSLAREAESRADALDALAFQLEMKSAHGVDLTRADDILSQILGYLIKDCKCLYDALERSGTCGLDQSVKRSSIEVSASRPSTAEAFFDLEDLQLNSDAREALSPRRSLAKADTSFEQYETTSVASKLPFGLCENAYAV